MKRSLETLQQDAPPIGKLSQSRVEYARILVDGFYGDHADMTSQTLEIMCKKAITIVTEEWKIPWNRVIWVSLTGTWMKAIPLILMQWGFGHSIEFYIPCQAKKTPRGFQFLGTEGRIISRSMDLMQNRLAETRNVKLCETPHMNVQLRQCVDQTEAAMFLCDDFKQQRMNTSNTSTHMIHFPHIEPSAADAEIGTKAYNDAYYNQGGKSFESKPTDKRFQVNVYDEIRKHGLGGKTVVI